MIRKLLFEINFLPILLLVKFWCVSNTVFTGSSGNPISQSADHLRNVSVTERVLVSDTSNWAAEGHLQGENKTLDWIERDYFWKLSNHSTRYQNVSAEEISPGAAGVNVPFLKPNVLRASLGAQAVNRIGFALTFSTRVFGSAANILNMMVFSSPRFAALPASPLFVALGFADFMTTFTKIPLDIWRSANSLFFGDKMGFAMEAYFKFFVIGVAYTFIAAGNWYVTVLSAYRVLAVWKPMQYKNWCGRRNVHLSTGLVMALCVLFWFNSAFNFRVLEVRLPEEATDDDDDDDVTEQNETVLKIVRSPGSNEFEVFKSTITFFLPWLLSSICTAAIIVKIKSSSVKVGTHGADEPPKTPSACASESPGSHQSPRLDDHVIPICRVSVTARRLLRTERRITFTLIALSLTYLVCAVPSAVRYIIRYMIGHKAWYQGENAMGNLALDWAANFFITLNSSVNILFYWAFNPAFRAQVFKFLLRPPPVASTQLSDTPHEENELNNVPPRNEGIAGPVGNLLRPPTDQIPPTPPTRVPKRPSAPSGPSALVHTHSHREFTLAKVQPEYWATQRNAAF